MTNTTPTTPELAMSLMDEIGIVDSDGDGWREFEGELLEIPMFRLEF